MQIREISNCLCSKPINLSFLLLFAFHVSHWPFDFKKLIFYYSLLKLSVQVVLKRFNFYSNLTSCTAIAAWNPFLIVYFYIRSAATFSYL